MNLQCEKENLNQFLQSTKTRYCQSLDCLNRPVPVTYIDLATGLMYQSCRQVLHLLRIADLFTPYTGGFRISSDVRYELNKQTNKQIFIFSKELTYIWYYILLQTSFKKQV